MEKSYTRFYALREMRARPKTFLPLFAIFFGVMLLMGNLLIYAQCQMTSDAAYYRVETQLIFPDLTDTEVEQLRRMSEVRQVEAVQSENGYIGYVELIDRLATDANAICTTLPKLIERLHLEDRSATYANFMRYYAENPAYAYDHTSMINAQYVDALRQSLFEPSTLLLMLIAALMLLAVTVLVFSMKISQSRKEYACLMGMGMGRRGIWSIQMWQGFLLVTAGYIPSQLLAILTMKIVSVLSYRIYPHFRGNTVILFDVPWLVLLLLYGLYLLAVAVGILLCLRSWKGQTLTEMLNDSGTKIPFVQESAEKFLSSGSFEGYGKLWQKRNRKTIRPMLVLFLLLILFPSLIAGMAMAMLEPDDDKDAIVSITPTTDGEISLALLEEMANIPGVTKISTYATVGRSRQIEGSVQYGNQGVSVVTESSTTVVGAPLIATFLMEEVPADGTVWVSEDFPGNVGDTIRVDTVTAVIERKTEELRSSLSFAGDHVKYPILLSLSLAEELYGEPITHAHLYGRLYSDLPETEIDGLLDTLFQLVGDTKVYLNEHDRWLHGGKELDVYLTNLYYENRVNDIQNTFMGLFLLVQTIYLLLCAAVVIGERFGSSCPGEVANMRYCGRWGCRMRICSGSVTDSVVPCFAM